MGARVRVPRAPPYLIQTSVRAEVYIENLALGTLALYFATHAAGEHEERRLQLDLAAVGLTLGVSFWSQLNTVFYGVAILTFWVIETPALLPRRAAGRARPSCSEAHRYDLSRVIP